MDKFEKKYFKSKIILVIGGTGTLGDEIIKQLLESGAKTVRSLSRNEHQIFLLGQKYKRYENRLRTFVGDVRDRSRLSKAMAGVDIVINCAAMKHVGICEENPFEAVKTNVNGAQNAVECAISHNIDLYVQISTDKAVNPINVYGATKLLAEQLTLDAINYQGRNRTKFIVIRSGNIIGSSGSCLEIWDSQKEQGLPITITDPDATRYMNSKDKIADTVLRIFPVAENGLYVLGMPEYRVGDLVKQYFGDYPTEIIGLSRGEKLAEELVKSGEKCIIINTEG